MASGRRIDPKYDVVNPDLELSDPNPDLHAMFCHFNELFFNGALASVTVQWSPRMTSCAGICRFKGRLGGTSLHISKPLMSLRQRKDLVETLLHEMIHAFLFLTDQNRERDDHGPKFQAKMFEINHLTGANISIYHSFHDEVEHQKTHWWKCSGPCQQRAPYFGIVKRSMNRAPGKSDFWFKEHEQNCGGQFTKIKEPEPVPKAKGVKRKVNGENNKTGTAAGVKSITHFFPKADDLEKKNDSCSSKNTNSEVQGSPDQLQEGFSQSGNFGRPLNKPGHFGGLSGNSVGSFRLFGGTGHVLGSSASSSEYSGGSVHSVGSLNTSGKPVSNPERPINKLGGPPKNSGGSGVSVNNSEYTEGSVQCPVCNRFFPDAQKLDLHIDDCITIQAMCDS